MAAGFEFKEESYINYDLHHITLSDKVYILDEPFQSGNKPAPKYIFVSPLMLKLMKRFAEK